MEGQVVHGKRFAGQLTSPSFDSYHGAYDAGIRGLNKEPKKPGNGGKEDKTFSFLGSWLPYCKSPNAPRLRAIQVLVVASPLWRLTIQLLRKFEA